MTMNLKNIANSYFASWKSHDWKVLHSLFSENIVFEGVLGKANGVDQCIDGLKGLAKIMTDIIVVQMCVYESDVITWYELYTTKTNNPLSIANWIHVENGKINKVRVTFDPRPLL